MKRYVKRIPDDNDIEVEYLDVDIILSNYIDEFLAKKQKNQKTITKYFAKFFQEQEGIFNTEEISTICGHVIPQENLVSPIVLYPGELSFIRAFLFALMSQNNAFDISNKNFLKGIGRFGIDSPLPSISKTLFLYGNEINIGELLNEKINSLEEAQQAIFAHQANLIGSNVIVRQPNTKNISIGTILYVKNVVQKY